MFSIFSTDNLSVTFKKNVPDYALYSTYENSRTLLTSVTIAEGVTSIGESAFYNCAGLTSINIPNSVTSIGEWAFFSCTGLTGITIGTGVTSIGDSAFSNCTSLTSITLPEGITSIGEWAFSYCSGLTSINIPEGVTSIGERAFWYCTGLTSINIPSGLTSIGEGVFYNCTSLTSVTIPGSVMSIGDYAFYNCTGLTEITIPEGVTSIGNYAFTYWTNSQTIYVEGFANQAAANAVWGSVWPWGCNAVIVYGIVTEIEITQQPNKTVYLIGDQLDITGLVVTARFNNNTTRTGTITAANITGFDSETTGTKTLTITYHGKTATFTVTVMELSSIAVTRQPNKTTYIIGEQLDITGIVVTANGTTATVPVTAANITGFDSATLGTKTLTVNYSGKTATFTVSVVNPLVVTNTTEWNAALTTLNGQTGSHIININGSFNVAGSTDLTFGTTSSGELTVTLKGSGTLSLNSNGNILRVGANQTIIIDSEDLILQGRDVNDASLIYVDGSSAQLELKNGTISGNTMRLLYYSYDSSATAYGGGVYVSAGGTFIMSGGTISGNTARASTSSGTAAAYGGGVYNAGTFIMTGGTISGNETRASSGNTVSYGGGVCNTGTFRIVNGTIYGSYANPSSLSNTLYGSASNYKDEAGAALYNYGTAQRGTFYGETWVSSGDLSTTNYTINVVNGASQ